MVAAMVVLGVSGPARGETPADKPVEEIDYVTDIMPLMQKYCFECHGPERQSAGLGLHEYQTTLAVQEDSGTWEAVVEMIEFGAMPPENRPQPNEEELQLIVNWFLHSLHQFDCEQGNDPGRVTIQRLNRAEYSNTIRDLLGVDIDPAQDFPSDDVGEGFDNIGDVLSLSPLLLERYMDAAEQVTEVAIKVPSAEQAETRRRAGRRLRPSSDDGIQRRDDDVYALYTNGNVSGNFEFPRDGKYILRARAGADQAGDELAKMAFILDDDERHVFEVTAPSRDARETYEVTVDVQEGRRRLAAAYTNDYYNPDAPDRNDRDRNLYIEWLEVVGPIDVEQDELPESHRRLITVYPEDPKDEAQVRRAAFDVLRPFVRRAFRRPVDDGELEPYVRLVQLVTENGETYELGIQVAVTGVLVSPHFLFRVETDPHPDDPEAIRTLNDFELATRLSYFLWSSMPDEELFKLAEEGKLQDDDVLRKQVVRMIDDPKSEALVTNFATQWLNLRNLAEIEPDPGKVQDFDLLRHDMQRETELFFASIMQEDRSILDFLQGRFTFVNQRLAEHYGLDESINGDGFQRVELTSVPRAGVLTHGSILTITSNPTRTSAVKRGQWIMTNILGSPPPEAPEGVPELEEIQESQPGATLREQLELHRQDPTCASCHRTMDALGFGFENFDLVGRWRDLDGDHAIDASGELPGGESFSGAGDLLEILGNRNVEFSRAMASKMLVYALGRGLRPFDQCTVDEIVEQLESNQYRFSALVTAIVLSDAFRMRRGEGAL